MVLSCISVAVVNLALNKPVIQSSTNSTDVASLAVDGVAGEASCTVKDVHPWLVIDLEAEYDVGHVIVIDDAEPQSNYQRSHYSVH